MILVLEDSPLFNAGRGGVYNRDGRHEFDAAVMEGSGLRAGAVAAVTRVRNPVSAARAVMDRSGHVLLAGPGADRFAEESGLEIVPPEYFATSERWDELQKKRDVPRDRHGIRHDPRCQLPGSRPLTAASIARGGMTASRLRTEGR